MKKKRPVTGIACGIFKKEIQALIDRGQLDLSFKFLDSMLHMKPAALETLAQKNINKIKKEQAGSDRVLMVYGDCHPTICQMDRQSKISKVAGINCCEIILGEKRYRSLRSQGVFFLLPEWTKRWKEVFQRQLGFDENSAKLFMADMHTRLIYLDTGVSPVPEKELDAVLDFCGLPVEIMAVNLDHLLSAILAAKG